MKFFMKRVRRTTGLAVMISGILALVDGCGRSPFETPRQKNVPGSPPAIQDSFTQSIRCEVIPTDVVHSYQIRISWGEGSQRTMNLLRNVDGGSFSLVSSVHPSLREFRDGDVVYGKRYTYRFEAEGDSFYQGQSCASVSVPQDLELSGTLEIRDISPFNHRFGRIVFQRGAHISTQGQSLSLDADVMDSRDAEISQFVAGQQAHETRRVGRSGGVLAFRAKKSIGKLQIVLRGEKGADGEAGHHPREFLNPGPLFNKHSEILDGLPGGRSGDLYIDIPDLSSEWSYIMAPGEGGEGGVAHSTGPQDTMYGRNGPIGAQGFMCINRVESQPGSCESLRNAIKW